MKTLRFILVVSVFLMVLISCSNDKKTNPDTEPPTVAITYPPNNSSFTSGTAINIVAEADDNEEVDNVKFYIDGVNLYEDTSEPYSYNWNTTNLSGTHTLYAKATDGSENTSTSDIVTVTITDSGEAPNPPSNPNPLSGAVNISTSTTLSWTCTDPNGDSLTYDVYFGTNVNPSLVSSDLTINNYNPGTLDETTTYYWYIIGTDTDENSTTGPLWSFTTLTSGGGNQAPNPPSNPNPEDNATDVSIETNLSWTCTDPEGDPLTYDVYFGKSTNPSAVSSGQSITTYDPGTLDEETTYYWKIVANDDHSNSTTGEIWEFETQGNQNLAPNTPENPVPANNDTDVSVNILLTWECTDPEGDPLTYDVYFGTSSNPPLMITDLEITEYNPVALYGDTSYYWKIVAHDNHQNSTIGEIWEFTTRTVYNSNFEWCNIPAGDFTFGQQPEIMNISYNYEIMKYEVTNEQYVDYLVEAYNEGYLTVWSYTIEGFYPGDSHYGSGVYEFYDMDSGENKIHWDGSSFVIDPSYENHPVNAISWFGAWAFAEHYGFRLPTEFEWEKAARGNTGSTYPWGENIEGSRANYEDSGDPWDNGTTPVGMYNGQTIQGFNTTDSPSPFNVYDMAGNVLDWVDSWENFGNERIIKGGGFDYNFYDLKSWLRIQTLPTYCHSNCGIRCIRLN